MVIFLRPTRKSQHLPEQHRLTPLHTLDQPLTPEQFAQCLREKHKISRLLGCPNLRDSPTLAHAYALEHSPRQETDLILHQRTKTLPLLLPRWRQRLLQV